MSTVDENMPPSLKNVEFKLLDQTLLPEFFQAFKCGCENTLEPCPKILEITSAKIDGMKKLYESGKRAR